MHDENPILMLTKIWIVVEVLWRGNNYENVIREKHSAGFGNMFFHANLTETILCSSDR